MTVWPEGGPAGLSLQAVSARPLRRQRPAAPTRLPPMHITIAPGVRLFVDIEGPSHVPDGPHLREKPTLILLHGGPGYDHSSFKPLFSALADVAQIVYVDHRGHGRSDRRPAAEWTLDTFADDVVKLCEALGVVRPIVLGQSFGGFVAQRRVRLGMMRRDVGQIDRLRGAGEGMVAFDALRFEELVER